MRVLFVSNYFPPEVNAPATRLYEHARYWARDGGDIDVLTAVPNFPEGEIYAGYENRFQLEAVDGIKVYRVPMYVAENKGTLKRTLSYISFMLSALWFSRKITARPDVVAATSPQFFCAIGGYLISRLKGVPFLLEIRDLWPESIVAVEAVKRNWLIRLFERIELFLYQRADHIVVVADSFKRIIVEKGIAASKITVLKNGADWQSFASPLNQDTLQALRQSYDFDGRFVVSYLGTIGMAHRADVLLEAAQRCNDPDVMFAVIGTGAERQKLEAQSRHLNLLNFRLIDKQPKHLMPYFLALSDACVVHLKNAPLFETVVPSKIFEAMIMRKPIIIGVQGEARKLVEEAGAGIGMTPEDPDDLVKAVRYLKANAAVCRTMAEQGFAYVRQHFDREKLAQRYWNLFLCIAEKKVVAVDSAKPD